MVQQKDLIIIKCTAGYSTGRIIVIGPGLGCDRDEHIVFAQASDRTGGNGSGLQFGFRVPAFAFLVDVQRH